MLRRRESYSLRSGISPQTAGELLPLHGHISSHEEFQLVNQGSIDKYLGLLILDIDANTFEMSQPFLIRRILEFLSLDENKTKGRDTPVGKPLLIRDVGGVPQNTLGYIVERLECSVILPTVFDLRYR